MKYNEIATEESISKTIASLKENGMEAIVVETGELAKQKVLELIPQNSEVMTMTSVTLEAIGLAAQINESGKYKATRAKLMDPGVNGRDKKHFGAAPEYTVGSVHAITEKGEVVIASNTGSQLPAYAYGSDRVVWVVGAQKLVPSIDEAMKRVYDYVLPLESERANKAYGITSGSKVRKMLIVNSELSKDRITIIIVKEVLGF